MAFTRFCFKLGQGENYIDLAKAMSMYFRTLVRQKQIFTVLGGQVVDNVSTVNAMVSAPVKISTAPNVWYYKAAINRCFEAWKAQRARTLQNTEQDGDEVATGKFADFKLSLNGVDSDAVNNLLPHFVGSGTISPIQPLQAWNTASVINESAQEKHFKIVGDHDSGSSGYYGCVKGWLETTPLPDAENEPDMIDFDGDGNEDYAGDFLNLLNETTDGQEARMNVVYNDNDDAPFAVREVFGGVNSGDNLQLQSLTYLSNTNPHQSIPGFKVLCGLLQVTVGQDASNPVLFLDVLNTPEEF